MLTDLKLGATRSLLWNKVEIVMENESDYSGYFIEF